MVFTTSTNTDRAFLARRAQISDLLIAVGDHLHHLLDTTPLSEQAGTLPPKPEGWPNHRHLRGTSPRRCRPPLPLLSMSPFPSRHRSESHEGSSDTRLRHRPRIRQDRTDHTRPLNNARTSNRRRPRVNRTTVREQSSLNAFGRCLHHLPRTDSRNHNRPLTSRH